MKGLAALALVVSCSSPELARESDRDLCRRWVAVAAEHLAACGADAAALEAWIDSKGARCERLRFVNPLAAPPAECIEAARTTPCEIVRTAETPIPWCSAFVTESSDVP